MRSKPLLAVGYESQVYIIESVAFFYIPDPLREPSYVKKKITWFKKRRHVHPLLSSGYVSDTPKHIRKTFLLIYTRNYK
jgi:hypothetical protein